MLLNFLKGFLVYDGFMGVWNYNPFTAGNLCGGKSVTKSFFGLTLCHTTGIDGISRDNFYHLSLPKLVLRLLFNFTLAVYGYLKDPDDRHKLVIDEYAADVVRDIFKWKLEGLSQQRIAERLDDQGILSPMEYKRYCGMKYKSGFQINPKARWTAVAIGRILKNEFYVGTLVQGKRSTPNHKIKKLMQKPENEWVRIEHNHEPIIEREIFDTVNRLLIKDTRIAPQAQKGR